MPDTETVASQTAGVSEKDVRHVANLANLELTEQEVPRMVRDLNSILNYITELNQLDTSSVPAMAQVGEMLGLTPDDMGHTLRPDVVKDSVDRAAVMAAAPETDGRFFKVPKVIER